MSWLSLARALRKIVYEIRQHRCNCNSHRGTLSAGLIGRQLKGILDVFERRLTGKHVMDSQMSQHCELTQRAVIAVGVGWERIALP